MVSDGAPRASSTAAPPDAAASRASVPAVAPPLVVAFQTGIGFGPGDRYVLLALYLGLALLGATATEWGLRYAGYGPVATRRLFLVGWMGVVGLLAVGFLKGLGPMGYPIPVAVVVAIGLTALPREE